MKPLSQSVNFPTQLASEVFLQNLLNPYKVYVASKIVTPGRFSRTDYYFQALCQAAGFMPRTILKHLKKLVELGLAGFDPNIQTWYIRPMCFLKKEKYFEERNSIKITLADLPNFRTLLAAAVITHRIQRHRYHVNKVLFKKGYRHKRFRELKSPAVIIGESASQGAFVSPGSLDGIPDYYGYSNQTIAKMLGLKPTRACVLKNHAEELGYIRTRTHYQLIYEFDHFIPGLIDDLKKGYSDSFHRFRIITRKTKNGCKYQVVMQIHDEIIPMLECIRINYNNKVKQKRKGSLTPVKIKPQPSLS